MFYELFKELEPKAMVFVGIVVFGSKSGLNGAKIDRKFSENLYMVLIKVK